MAKKFCASNLQYGPYFLETPAYRKKSLFINFLGICRTEYIFLTPLCALVQRDGGFLSLKMLNIRSIYSIAGM